MFNFGGFANDFIMLIHGVVQIYLWVVIIRVLISWISPDPNNPIVQFLRGLTDPVIDGLRRMLPSFFWSSGLDFTPLILIILLQVLMAALRNLRL